MKSFQLNCEHISDTGKGRAMLNLDFDDSNVTGTWTISNAGDVVIIDPPPEPPGKFRCHNGTINCGGTKHSVRVYSFDINNPTTGIGKGKVDFRWTKLGPAA